MRTIKIQGIGRFSRDAELDYVDFIYPDSELSPNEVFDWADSQAIVQVNYLGTGFIVRPSKVISSNATFSDKDGSGGKLTGEIHVKVQLLSKPSLVPVG